MICESAQSFVFIGLSITSAWGNGHATTYRSLLKGLARRGHDIVFLEQDAPWYADKRDLPQPSFCRTELYRDFRQLQENYGELIRKADVVVVGSFVREGKQVCAWVQREARGVKAFYDIDTPRTIKAIEGDCCEYLSRSLIPGFDLYLSFTAGPTLDLLMKRYHSPRALPLLCAVDSDLYYPMAASYEYDLGYLGTYSSDRQPMLRELLLQPAQVLSAQRFIVAGAQYPTTLEWPKNVEHEEHVCPTKHVRFFNSQRFTLNITRADMMAAGYSPSVRLFEAAACGTAIITDRWPGLEEFFVPGKELLVGESAADVIDILQNTSESERQSMGLQARRRVLVAHTANHRAQQLECYVTGRSLEEAA